MPALPKTIEQFVLPSIFELTESGEQFKIMDDEIGEDRVVGFASEICLEILFGSDDIFIDGTFDVVPDPFIQLVTVHGIVSNQGAACAYFLATSKAQQVYSAIFKRLKTLAVNQNKSLSPNYIHSDFELAIMQACEKTFPNTVNVGCYFHYAQAIFRRFCQKFYLKKEVSSDPQVKEMYELIKVIPFIPQSRLRVKIFSNKFNFNLRKQKSSWKRSTAKKG